MMKLNPMFLIDFYKVGHINQYPAGVQQIWSNWTMRYAHNKQITHGRWFGMQYYIKEYLLRQFNENFFAEKTNTVIDQYREVISKTLNKKQVRVDHIEWLHSLGYLPLKIYSLPEGTGVPIGVPAAVFTNTLPEGFWLPNYFETMMSNILWKPVTSATTARMYRDIFVKHAREFGNKDLSFVDWQGHDFSYRGMSGTEDAILSGMAHLLMFSGTDTIPAILGLQEYYGGDLTAGGSVDATEHSVMSAGGEEGEFETFKRLITKDGTVSIVSDTWDLWRVLTDYLPRLKNEIMNRDGLVVIRPDSGDPVKIIVGDESAKNWNTSRYRMFWKDSKHPAYYGAAELLQREFGADQNGMLNKVRLIYGDGISPQRAEDILSGLRAKNLNPYNQVFGIGSYSYQMVTRDNLGQAMKATGVRIYGQVKAIFKNPITDDGGKVSHKGIPIVYRTEDSTDEKPDYFCTQNGKPEDLDNCAFDKVFEDSKLLVEVNLETLRKRARA